MCLLVGLVGCDRPEKTAGDRLEREGAARTRANLPERGQVQGRNEVFEAALQAALALQSPEARDQALAAFVLEAHEAAPGLAAEALSHLPEGSEVRAATLQSLAEMMARKGVDRALQWVESLPTAQEIAWARQLVGLALAQTDAALGAQVVLQHHDRRGALDEVEQSVLQLWAGSNAPEALAWVRQLPQGDGRQEALLSVCEPWVKEDAAAAFAWIGAADKETKTEMITAMAVVLAGFADPARNGFLDQAEPAIREEIKLRLGEVIGTPIETPDEEPEDQGADQSANPHEPAVDDFAQPL